MTTIKDQPRRDSVFTTLTNYLIVSGMLTCVVIGVVQLGVQVAPAWNAGYVPVLCFFVALESAYMTRYLRYGKPPVPWYAVRGVEAIVIFFMLRSLLGLMHGPQPEQKINPFYGSVDGELLALTVIALLTWAISWLLTSNLLDLEVIDPLYDRELIKDVAQVQADSRQSLITFTFILGVILASISALISSNVQSSAQSKPGAPITLWHVLIYFLLALTLFSRARLSLLRAGWTWESLPVGQGVGRRWITYTLIMLAGVFIIAALLPTQYSLGLLGTLGYMLNILIAVVQLIIYVVALLIFTLLSLFIPNAPDQARPLPPPQPPPVLPGAPTAAPVTISEFAQSLIFWSVFFIAAGYMVAQFLRRHPEIADVLKRLPGVGLLIRLWHRVQAWFGGLSQQLEDLREARRRARRPSPARSAAAPPRFVNPRKLSPRQQVQFFYLAMLRRGGESGHPREVTQTPYEYARTLEGQLPDLDEDITALTDEFVEARYSRHEITPEKAGLVRRYWERIKRALKK